MTDEKPRGRFVWFDLMTNDPAAAPDFYSPVTGWGTSVWNGPVSYTMWTANGAPVGGVMTLSSHAGRPHWLCYICATNVDETVQVAVDLGARVVKPSSDIPGTGRFAVMRDPQGALFAVFTPESKANGHDGEPQIGEFSWHELATHDYPAAYRFYERLFGWEKAAAMDMGGGNTYQMFSRKGVMLGGIYNKPPQSPEPSAWLHYVRVRDLDAAVAAVKERGGQIVAEPMVVPGGDLIAQCLDPQGAPFALHAKKA